jgi:hypothetical protein
MRVDRLYRNAAAVFTTVVFKNRKSAGNLCWIAFWRQDGRRRGQILSD